MLAYFISAPEPGSGFLHIDFQIPEVPAGTLDIHLPAWRPGRYELQNYAANIRSVTAFDTENNTLPIIKTNRNTWQVQTQATTALTIRYQYFARQMDAGSCWLDETLCYLNFSNCLFYIKDRETQACQAILQLPPDYQIGCGLPVQKTATGAIQLTATDFYELTDSPLVAAATLQHIDYQIHHTTFHIWTRNEGYAADMPAWKRDFERFTALQGSLFGGFPFSEYHFLLFLLPHKAYHGVEHRNSTVITLGVFSEETGAEPAALDTLYHTDLPGIASHELFHAWNICRIRPAELLPYDLSRENYFHTGYVAEGITTYYGDLMLVRSGVWNREAFFAKLAKTLNRHFTTSDHASQNLLQASFDLWVDGYKEGIPGKKVSIYHKGCAVALLLDLEIRKLTDNQASLDKVMQQLWEHFGKQGRGYTHEDFIQTCENVAGQPLTAFFERFVAGNAPVFEPLQQALQGAGVDLFWETATEKSAFITLKQLENLNPTQQDCLEKWLKQPLD